jgi:hypothetical protein
MSIFGTEGGNMLTIQEDIETTRVRRVMMVGAAMADIKPALTSLIEKEVYRLYGVGAVDATFYGNVSGYVAAVVHEMLREWAFEETKDA